MNTKLRNLLTVIAGAILLFYLLKSWSGSFCEEASNNFKNNYQRDLILQKKERGDGLVTLYGIDPITKKQTTFVDGSKTFSSYFDSFLVGDTIVKNKGEYTIFIRRKGKIIPYYYDCEGHTYLDNPNRASKPTATKK